jgi:hypothetical protein
MKREMKYSVDMVGVRICGTWWENGLRNVYETLDWERRGGGSERERETALCTSY